MELHGNLIDIHQRKIFSAAIVIENGKITAIKPNTHRKSGFLLPGFVDAHIHIESSLLPPSEFARMAVRHGTVATVSDPHEIASVLGISGVEYMLENARKSPFKFYFGAPSSLPTKEVEELLKKTEIKYLSEVMNFPGVLTDDPVILEKIAIAKRLEKRVDGHAPEVFGNDLKKYFSAGIETDHECTTLSEAREKHALGMKILIREGSESKNFDSLLPLMQEDPENCMLCTDHLAPNHLLLGHINLLVKKAVQSGMNLMDVLQVACKNPVDHYGLEVGLLRVGDSADCIIVEDLESFRVLETYIEGECVFKESPLLPQIKTHPVNRFATSPKIPKDFAIPIQEGEIHVIKAIDEQHFTKDLILPPKIEGNQVVSDLNRDILKIAVINRYTDAPPAVGFVKNFGLKKGAMASTIAHESHNIVAVGVSDQDLCEVVNALIKIKGGIALSNQGQTSIIPLPIAGLMSNLEGEEVAIRYSNLEEGAKTFGSSLTSPFMTLSFMTQIDLPELKINEKGLFDSRSLSHISLFT